jgi:hypothetical protein
MFGAGGMAQIVEHLSSRSKPQDLISNPGTTKRKKKKKFWDLRVACGKPDRAASMKAETRLFGRAHTLLLQDVW